MVGRQVTGPRAVGVFGLSVVAAGSTHRHMGLSRRAYGRHRGVSLAAVQKALRAGRITLLSDGTIDPEAADKTWNAAAEGAAPAADARKVVLPPRQFAAAEATVQAVLGEHGVEVNGGIRLADVRLANELLRAQLRADTIRAQRARVRYATGVDLDVEEDAGFDEVGDWWRWCDATATELAAALGVRRRRVQEPLAVALRRHLEDLGLVAREDEDDAADEEQEVDVARATSPLNVDAEEQQHARDGEDDEEPDDEDLEDDQDEDDAGEPDGEEEPLRVEAAAADDRLLDDDEDPEDPTADERPEVAAASRSPPAAADAPPVPPVVVPVLGPAPITWRRSTWWNR